MKILILLLLIVNSVCCSRIPEYTVNTEEITKIVEQNLQKKYENEKSQQKPKIDPNYQKLNIGITHLTVYEINNLSKPSSNVIYSDNGKLYYLVDKDGSRFNVYNSTKTLYGYYRPNQRIKLYLMNEQKTFVRDRLNDIQIEDDYVFDNRIKSDLVGYDMVKEVGFKTAILNQIGYISEKIYACHRKISAEVFQVYQWEEKEE